MIFQKTRGASAVEYKNRCIKFDLPNGKSIDVLNDVLTAIKDYIQSHQSAPESAGLLLGYQNSVTKNITISDYTVPQSNDIRARFFCKIKDSYHFLSLRTKAIKQNFYIGSWHTHPQTIPEPSSLDWCDWNDTLSKDKSGADFFVFIILGTKEFRIWCGDPISKKIVEIFESQIHEDLYTER